MHKPELLMVHYDVWEYIEINKKIKVIQSSGLMIVLLCDAGGQGYIRIRPARLKKKLQSLE